MDVFTGRINEFEDKKRMKVEQMRAEKQDKELDGCTFAPQMMTKKKKNVAQPRDLNKFLEDQQRYEEARKEKFNKRKEQELQNEVAIAAPRPVMNAKSKRMLARKESQGDARAFQKKPEPAVESRRQQRTHIPKPQSAKKPKSPPKETFKPTISKKAQGITRDRSIQDHLYQQALI